MDGESSQSTSGNAKRTRRDSGNDRQKKRTRFAAKSRNDGEDDDDEEDDEEDEEEEGRNHAGSGTEDISHSEASSAPPAPKRRGRPPKHKKNATVKDEAPSDTEVSWDGGRSIQGGPIISFLLWNPKGSDARMPPNKCIMIYMRMFWMVGLVNGRGCLVPWSLSIYE